MIASHSLRRRKEPFQRLVAGSPRAESLLRALILLLAFAAASLVAAAKPSQRPRVFADASLIDGLTAAPVPNYPTEAVKKHWAGFGLFELHFRSDGTVQDVVTLLTTGHQLLDNTARASLLKWRCKPGAQRSPRMTMSFSTRDHLITLDPASAEVVKNFPVHPLPTYPLEARRRRWAGTALFVMRFREDGSVEKVVALRSTGHEVLDDEGIRTLLRWRCLPGVYTTAYIPVTFTTAR